NIWLICREHYSIFIFKIFKYKIYTVFYSSHRNFNDIIAVFFVAFFKKMKYFFGLFKRFVTFIVLMINFFPRRKYKYFVVPIFGASFRKIFGIMSFYKIHICRNVRHSAVIKKYWVCR